MTIAERRTREEYDREHPWQPVSLAKPGPEICELRISDTVGLTDCGRARFFLHDDRRWYQIEPPAEMWSRVTEFRQTGSMLSDHRRASVVHRALDRDFEYRGGQLHRKPKPYKLFWRAED